MFGHDTAISLDLLVGLIVETLNDLGKYQIHDEKGSEKNQRDKVNSSDIGVGGIHEVVHHSICPVLK